MLKTINPSQVDVISFKAYRYEYKWSIPNFKKIATTYAPGDITESEYINCMLKDKNKKFHLKLYPHGYNERMENYISVFLKKYYKTDEILIQFTVSILDVGNKTSHVKSIKKIMNIEPHLGWMSFCRRDLLLDDNNSILTDGNLNLNCTIEIFENKAIPMAETEDDVDLSHSKMSHVMNRLLSDGQFSDVIFKVDGDDLKFHKAILSARSFDFKAKTKSQLKGGPRVNNIDVDALKQLSLYMMALLAFILIFFLLQPSGDVRCTDVQTKQEL